MPTDQTPPSSAGGPDPRPPTWQRTLQVTMRAVEGGRWRAIDDQPAPPPDAPPVLGGAEVLAALPGAAGDRYAVEATLGRGATAAVWAVYDRRLQRPLAAKVLDRPVAEAGVDGFIEEARTTARLQHPNVLPVHELAVTADGRPFFTMDRVEGRSLGRALAESTRARRHRSVPDANAIVAVVIAVANALSYAHHRGIVHQDVKPENIMLGDFGEVLLVDWGSAQRFDGAPRLVYGTPLYMSPEQAARGEVDARSDVYCLGATLFHALALRPPVWDEDEESFWRRKRAGDVDPPTADERRRLPAALLAIALKAMAAQPRQRYQTADALIADLRAYQGGLAVSAQPETAGRRAARWCRRNARALAVGVPIAGCIAALALLLYGQRLKQMADWGQPVVREAFADPALPGWTVGRGGFACRDGAVVSTGPDTNLLVLRRRFDGDVAVEYDAWLEPGSQPGDLSVMWFPRMRFRDDGTADAAFDDALQAQFGARDGAFTMLTAGPHVVYDLARPEPGHRYHVRVELRDNVLAIAVDGRERCRHVDPLPLRAGWLGLYGYYGGKAFSDLRVYVRRVPQLVPATAVGDGFLRQGQAELAAAEYGRVADAHPGTGLAEEAAFRTGLAWWKAADYPAAEAAWRAVRDPAWGDEIELVRLDTAIEHATHLEAAAAIDRLAGERPRLVPRLANAWCGAVEGLIGRSLTADHRAEGEAYLAVRGRRLTTRPVTGSSAARLLLYLERWQDVLDRMPEQREECCRAAMALGHPEWVPERWPDRSWQIRSALFAMARYAELPAYQDRGYDLASDPAVLSETGRVAEVVARRPGALHQAMDIGQLDRALRYAAGEQWPRAMVLAGRAADITTGHDDEVVVLMAQGRVERARAEGETHPQWYAWPRFLLGLRAAIAGDHDAAEAWFAIPPQREFTQVGIEPARTLVLPLLRELAGDHAAIDRACAETIARRRWLDRQRPWYLARYLLGEIDDDGFRAQPYQLRVEADLLLARAVRAEHRGRPGDALAAYRAWDALPRWARAEILDPVREEFVAWRLARLEAH